jgi:AraC-like DNA-binding protein
MSQIRDAGSSLDVSAQSGPFRAEIQSFLERALDGQLALLRPSAPPEPSSRGDGHFHLAPELFLQLRGWTEFTLPQQVLRLDAGQALILPPRLRHAERIGDSGSLPEERFANLVIFSDGKRLSCHRALEQHPGLPGISQLVASEHSQSRLIHDWLMQAWQCRPDSAWTDRQALSLLATALAGVLHALEAAQDDPPSAEPPLLARARNLIQNELGDLELSVQGLATNCGCTADHLSHLFRKHTGQTLVAYINRLRMERAARLLRESSLAIKEVAWACGYASAGYFIRVFKQHHGLTPQGWRTARAAPAAI